MTTDPPKVYAKKQKSSRFPEVWITNEPTPRKLVAHGYSAVDPDCLVAYEEGSDKALWIVESGGYVCGLKEVSHD